MNPASSLLKLITKLFGKNALQKSIGTRPNVIRLPSNKEKRVITQDLNIEAGSDKGVQKIYEDAEKMVSDLAKMNDQELLTFEGNLRRLDNRLNPPSAEVIDIKTKKPATGIEQLAETQKIRSGMFDDIFDTMMEQQKKEGVDLETMMKGKKPSEAFEEMVMKNPYRPGGPLDPAVGITRAGARLILEKKGIKIGGDDPLDLVRENFGQDVLNDINNVSEELLEIDMRGGTYKDLSDVLEREGLFDVPINKNAPKGYTDEEMKKLLKENEEKDLGDKLKNLPDDIDPDAMAEGGRVGKESGGVAYLMGL